MIRTYWLILNLGIQNTLCYRVNFLVRTVFNLVPLLAFIIMWRAIYAGKGGEVSGYSLAEMISYYLIVTVVETITAVTEDDWQIAADIKDGLISQFLTRPINYPCYRLCLFFAGRVVYVLAAFIPVGLFVFCNRHYLLAPPDALTCCWFAASLLCSALLQFYLSYLVAMLAFWVLEISTFVFTLLALQRLAGGELFPLDLLPHWLTQALMWTPFPYAVFFPVSIYLGKVTGPDLAQGMLLQVLWTAAVYGAARWVWGRGLRTYTVVGG